MTRPGKRKDPEIGIDVIGPAVPGKGRNVDTAARVQAITTVPKEDTAKFLKKIKINKRFVLSVKMKQ